MKRYTRGNKPISLVGGDAMRHHAQPMISGTSAARRRRMRSAEGVSGVLMVGHIRRRISLVATRAADW